MKTLIFDPIHPEAESLLKEKASLLPAKISEFNQSHPDVEAVVLRTHTTLTNRELDLLPNLKYIVSCSVGLDNLDLEEIKQRNINLIHCPGTNANSVAEHTVYFIFSLLRNSERPFPELKNKTLGIIGFGHIGKLVAKKFRGCDLRIIAFDIIQPEEKVLNELNVEMKTFDEVLAESDILTIHVNLNKHTEKLINGPAFEKMKDHSYFINTSRAEVVDEEALLHYFDLKKFKGLALDTYSESLKQNLSQNANKNIFLTDHVAAQGEESFREMCLQPIKKFVEEISHKVNNL